MHGKENNGAFKTTKDFILELYIKMLCHVTCVYKIGQSTSYKYYAALRIRRFDFLLTRLRVDIKSSVNF